MSVERNNLEVAKALLDGGAIHDIGFFNNYKGPLHLAVEKGHLEMVKLLIDHHVNVNAFDRSFRTPLHVVCSLGTLKNANYIEIVKELIKAGADVNAKDLYENTPLHLVSKNCLNDVIDLLLTAGAEVNSKNNKDNSPLHLVSNKQVSTNTLQRLVKAGSETNVANCYGKTPLHQLATHLSPKMLEILLKNGALANIYDYHDLDAMSYVIDNCKYNMPKKKLGESLNAIRLLIDNGSDINRMNKRGFSTLYLALFNNCHSKIVSFLLRCGSIIDFDSIMIQKTIKQKEISESSRLLIKHAALYDVQCRKDMLLNFSLDKLNKQQQELYAHCKKELLFMKMMIIEGTVSLFDFLTDKDVSAYVQDENILKVFNINHITLSFPNYSEMLSDRFSSEQLKLENSQKK
ncbi:serine/threonine-protein phosphatase 6 regulatory ankyrin repeat subunit C-like [Copidosoma floridanum]|uniref:serine/threonine-protein phosphatase 6 regulatory ankyrin repeat subunit C-like n=1 Tax=Copidosoma floridanum TaxID=29053 RepID=UPI0006C9602D|nr:serine/threonine-protein phosphatase 6 regulatory ankyrin repeat subunit C-like [Copidosoma floridanum]